MQRDAPKRARLTVPNSPRSTNQPNKQTENTKTNQHLLLFYCTCIVHLDHSGVDPGPTYGGEGEGGPVEAVDVLGQQVRVPLRHGKNI